MKDLQTPFQNPIAPVSSGARDGQGTSGGFDIPDGRKETPNGMSGLPVQPTTFDIPDGAGVNAQFNGLDPQSPGTFKG